MRLVLSSMYQSTLLFRKGVPIVTNDVKLWGVEMAAADHVSVVKGAFDKESRGETWQLRRREQLGNVG